MDNSLTREEKKSKARENRYEKAKRFSNWFSKRWWVICAVLNLCNVVNFIVMAINATDLHSQLLRVITVPISLTLLLGMVLALVVYSIACYIVDDYEGNE